MKFSSFSWLQSRTARKYLHSYLMISLIPAICICLIYCVGSANTMCRQAEEAMQTQLEQLKSELDATITFLENSTGHLSGVVSTQKNPYFEGSPEEEEHLVQQLNTYSANFQIPCEVVYYPRNGVNLYTLEGKTDYATFQKNSEFQDELDMIQFYKKLNCAQGRTFLTTEKTARGEDGNYLIYLSPVPNFNASPVGSVAFILNRQYFDAIIKSYCGDFGGYFFMLDRTYGISYTYDQCGKADAEIVSQSLSTSTDSRVRQATAANETYVSLRSVSKNYGFTYLYAIPTKVLYAPVYQKLLFFAALSVMMLLALLAAAFWTAASNFKPIFQLAGDLLRGGRSGKTDLFEQIRSQYTNVLNQNDDLQQQIQSQNTFSRQRILSELLYGWHGEPEKLPDILVKADIRFPYRDFFVMTVQLEQDADPQGTILHAFEEVRASSRQFWTVFLLETNTPHTAALLFNLEQNAGIREQAAGEIAQALTKAGYSRVKIGIGSFRTEPQNINVSYCEALVAMQTSASVVSLFQKPQTDDSDFLCPSVEGKMLQQGLMNGSEETAVDALRRMAAAVEERHPPFHIARCFCFYVVNLLLQMKPFLEDSLPEEELIDAASHAELAEFCTKTAQIIEQLCRQICDSRQMNDACKTAELMTYLKEHFGDYDLSVELLASHFSLSEKIVRQILKEQTGGSLTTFLTKLRMDSIKQQLAEMNIPIRELILAVGYTDASSFTRKFRMLEGMAPGQYRILMQNARAPHSGSCK